MDTIDDIIKKLISDHIFKIGSSPWFKALISNLIRDCIKNDSHPNTGKKWEREDDDNLVKDLEDFINTQSFKRGRSNLAILKRIEMYLNDEEYFS